VNRPGTTRQSGFTLIEVLVALVVLAVAVVAVLQLFGGGLRLARASGDHLEATLLASSMLTDLAWETLEEGTTEGSVGAFRWSRQITVDPALLPEEPDPARPDAVKLARVSVDVRWGKNRHVELVTIRPLGQQVTGSAPAGGPGTTPFPGAAPGTTPFPGIGSGATPFPGAGSGTTPFSGRGSGTNPFPGAGSGRSPFPGLGR
jgi:general secretion pathway protein I